MLPISLALRAPALAVLGLSPSLVRGESTRDPIEGKWSGVTGFPQDRVAVGLEFKENAKHELKV